MKMAEMAAVRKTSRYLIAFAEMTVALGSAGRPGSPPSGAPILPPARYGGVVAFARDNIDL